MQKQSITLGNVIIHFVHLAEPAETLDGKLKYSCRVILPHEHPQQEDLTELYEGLAEAAFGTTQDVKFTLKDADQVDAIDAEKFPEYAGALYFPATSKFAPTLITAALEKASSDYVERHCYSGARVNCTVQLFTWSSSFGKGVSANLQEVMFTETGQRLQGAGDEGYKERMAQFVNPTTPSGPEVGETQAAGKSKLDEIRAKLSAT